MTSVRFEVKSNKFKAASPKMRVAVGKRVRASTLRAEGDAKGRSRVDQGTMRAGWQSRFPNDLTGEVVNAVEHTIHNEMGTNRMSAQPMLVPAIEAEAPRFEASLTSLLGELA